MAILGRFSKFTHSNKYLPSDMAMIYMFGLLIIMVTTRDGSSKLLRALGHGVKRQDNKREKREKNKREKREKNKREQNKKREKRKKKIEQD